MLNKAQKDFIKLLDSIALEKTRYEVFCDFIAMSGLAFAQVGHFDEKRENHYLDLVAKYKKEDQQKFPELLAYVVDGMNYEYSDFLGEIYMACNFGSSNQGQFFTPYSVCKVCAVANLPAELDNDRIITLADPCIGGAAMCIAMCEVLRDRGFNFQNNLLIHGTDVSINSVYMALIQLSVIGVPAVIVHGNSLSLEDWGVYETPAVGYSLIQERLRSQKAREQEHKKEKEFILEDASRDYKQSLLFGD